MSIRGRLFHILLRNRHLLRGKLKPSVIDQDTSIDQLRRETDEMAMKLVKTIDGISY